MELESLATAIDRASEIAGSDTALARQCGVTQAAIWNARHRKRISPSLALKVETATDGKVDRTMMRPDLWPLNEQSSASLDSTAVRDRGSSADPIHEISEARRPSPGVDDLVTPPAPAAR